MFMSATYMAAAREAKNKVPVGVQGFGPHRRPRTHFIFRRGVIYLFNLGDFEYCGASRATKKPPAAKISSV